MYQVTFLPILAAGIANVIIGMIWYSPRVFGTLWMRWAGITPDMMQARKRRMPIYALVGLLSSMLIAYVMNYFGIDWNVYAWPGALQLGFWCWAGFTAPILLSSVIWEQKPFRLFLLNAIYWLMSFMVMALILLFIPSLFGPM